MRKLFIATIAAGTMLAAPAFAQDSGIDDQVETDLAPMAERLGDPETQQRLSETIGVLGEMLLDLPLAPLAQAVAQAAGEDADTVDPDMTLRKVAPETSDIPRELATNVPRTMDALAGMLDGFQAMLPALRDMADRLDKTLQSPTSRDQ